MRRLILIAFLLIHIPFCLSAQITKGTFITGGSLYFEFVRQNITDDNDKYFSIDGQAAFGYFPIKNFSIKVNPVISYSFLKHPVNLTLTEQGFLENENFDIGLAPSLTYYFLNDKFLPFIQFETLFLHSDQKSQWPSEGEINERLFNGSKIGINPGIGLLYRINNSIGVDLTLKYTWSRENYKYDYDDGSTSHNQETDMGLKIFFSFLIFL
jgi:hypothetical protein